MKLHELLYRKYNGIALTETYIEWAQSVIFMDIGERVAQLASMQPPYNLFEIEELFEQAVREIGWVLPSEVECALFHIRTLHKRLLLESEDAFEVVKEIYSCSLQYDITDIQRRWHEPSEWIDQLQYDKAFSLSKEDVLKKITAYARSLWHSEKNPLNLTAFTGRRITDVVAKDAPRFTVEFEHGRLMIDCAWRIRNSETILIGEADMHSDHMSLKDVRDLLLDKTIRDVQLWGNCSLLMLQVDDLFIDVFHTSTLWEGWSMTDDHDSYLFSDHGGHVY